jgi:hypothetical protein
MNQRHLLSHCAAVTVRRTVQCHLHNTAGTSSNQTCRLYTALCTAPPSHHIACPQTTPFIAKNNNFPTPVRRNPTFRSHHCACHGCTQLNMSTLMLMQLLLRHVPRPFCNVIVYTNTVRTASAQLTVRTQIVINTGTEQYDI